MHKLLVLYPPPVDPDAFRTYYEEVHLPLALKMPGLRNWHRAYDLVDATGGESPYFCTFEGEFDDAEAFGASMGSPEGQAAGADVPNFATGGVVILHFDTEEA